MLNRKFKTGFTLAEVLITLALIGVIATMTLPIVIAKTNASKFRSQYKKSIATLNQAVKVTEGKDDLNFASVTSDCGGSTDNPVDRPSMCAIMNGSLVGSSYYTSATIPSASGEIGKYSPSGFGVMSGSMGYYLMADGSLFAFPIGAKRCALPPGEDVGALNITCIGFIDVNGTTPPNKAVSCSVPSKTKVTRDVGDCTVRDNAVDMGDVFPVAIHDSVVEPLTNAAKYVLGHTVINTKD